MLCSTGLILWQVVHSTNKQESALYKGGLLFVCGFMPVGRMDVGFGNADGVHQNSSTIVWRGRSLMFWLIATLHPVVTSVAFSALPIISV